ncbi:MAG: phage minor capsid protein [Breznakia sp.]
MTEKEISSIFEEMEDYLLNSMSRNLKRHKKWEEDEGFNWDMWQSRQLESLNDYRKRNQQYVNKQSSNIKLKLNELLTTTNADASLKEESKILEAIQKGYKPKRIAKGLETSFFKSNDRKLNALFNNVNDDLNTAMSKMLNKASSEYSKIITKANTFASTGTMTIDQAVDMATKDFLSKGINCVTYSNGNNVNIVSYAEMAIRTANKKAYLQGEGAKRQEWGVSTILVSQYGACSPICLPLQGKVYIDDVYSGGKSDGKHPLLSEAIAAGLYHPNCKHSQTTYFEGITEIPTPLDAAQTSENSKAVATQRYNERQIRRYKRLEDNSLDSKNKEHYGERKRAWQKRQTELMKDYPDLRRNLKRESVRGVTGRDDVQDVAFNMLKKAREVEPNITSNVETAVKENGAKLYGKQWRLKTEQSLERKIRSDMLDGGITLDEVKTSIYDNVRYTSILNDETFVKQYDGIIESLQEKGYNLTRLKNTLGDENAMYRGVNALVKTKDDYIFELQFHTQESIKIKNEIHPLYEEFRLDATSLERKKELQTEMMKLSKSLKVSKDVKDIKNIDMRKR